MKFTYGSIACLSVLYVYALVGSVCSLALIYSLEKPGGGRGSFTTIIGFFEVGFMLFTLIVIVCEISYPPSKDGNESTTTSESNRD